jgi:carboxylesterase
MSRILAPERPLGFSLKGSQGKAVLLAHGMTGAPGEMKFLAKRLHRRGFSVEAPLLAGHGRDEAHLLSTTWRDWLDSLRPVCARLAQEHDEVYVAGICVGGALGLALAAEEPAVRAAAVYSMTYRYDGWNMQGWWSTVAPFVDLFAGLPLVRRLSFVEPYPFGLKDERLREGMAATQGAVIPGALDRVPLGAMQQMYRLANHLDRIGKTIRTPTLILHARDDDMSHPRNALRLQASLGGRAEVRLLDDCFHMIHVDQQRDEVGDLTAAFFAEAAAPRVAPRPLAAAADA